MKLLNIIDKIYESKYFATILVIAVIILVVLFVVVLILGVKDSKRSKEVSKKEEDLKDITFDVPKGVDVIKEDVTFEMPILTKDLENFKKSLEEEIQKDQEVEIRTTKIKSLGDATRPVKILDMNVIEDTATIPSLILDENEEENKFKDKEDDYVSNNI